MVSFSKIAGVGFIAALLLSGCGGSEPQVKASAPGMRRLTETQYRNIIADLFGAQISIAGRFDPLLRDNGLATVGAWNARITSGGIEQYEKMAQSIAAQVTSPANRDVLVACKPQSAKQPDDACARQFFTTVGRLLERHPLAAEDLDAMVKMAHQGAAATGDFYNGLASGLSSILISPAFLYAIDTLEADKDHPGTVSLDAYGKASRLSFLLWNSTPDDELLTVAEKGGLNSKAGVKREVERMLASPRVEAGVRAFFSDMLDFDQFENCEKDTILYPAFSLAVANDAKEQTLRTISNMLVKERADYRDLFTTRKTFISGALGRVYQVKAPRPDGGWVPFEFPADDPRSGVVTQIAFTALYAHPGRSSPTLRGKAIRESLLCQKVPAPPGDVDFSQFNDPKSPIKTARQRLEAHAVNATCAGCHHIMDPLGLALEKVDGAGQLRTTENGEPIDTSGDLDGIKYSDTVGLGKALHDNPALPSCVVRRMFAYATGRSVSAGADKELVDYLEKGFASDGYRVPDLLRRIATSDAFLSVSASASEVAPTTADNQSPGNPASNAGAEKENKS